MPRSSIHVDSSNYGIIEDAHQPVMHLLAQYVRQSRMTPDAVAVTGLLTTMRVAINLLTDDPAHPSGAHWFWTRIIPEMAKRSPTTRSSTSLVSPKSRPMHEGYGPGVHYITFPGPTSGRRCGP